MPPAGLRVKWPQAIGIIRHGFDGRRDFWRVFRLPAIMAWAPPPHTHTPPPDYPRNRGHRPACPDFQTLIEDRGRLATLSSPRGACSWIHQSDITRRDYDWEATNQRPIGLTSTLAISAEIMNRQSLPPGLLSGP